MSTSTLFSGVSIARDLLDPLASAPSVVDEVTHRLESELKRISSLTEQLRKSVSMEMTTETPHVAEIAMPSNPSQQQMAGFAEVGERVKKAKRDARDAWCAVVLMGMFIVGGIIWSTDRIEQSQAKIDELTMLLNAEKSAAIARVDKMQKLQVEVAAMKKLQVNGMKPVETVRISTDE